MVFFQKIALSLLVVSIFVYGQTDETVKSDTFLAKPAPSKKKTPLSKSRSEAAQKLEALAHSLTKEIAVATALLDEVMYAVRDCAEGDTKSTTITALQKDRNAFIDRISSETVNTRERVKQLQSARDMCAPIGAHGI